MVLNAWDPLIEQSEREWGPGLPLGTVSVLVVTGPSPSSAAQERLRGLRETVRPDIQLQDTEAGQWSDDVAVGARSAAIAVSNPRHVAMFEKALLSPHERSRLLRSPRHG